MTAAEVRIERLVGREVRARNGRPVGRLHEIRVQKRGDERVVSEYLIGAWGLLERFSLLRIWHPRGARGYRARWDQLDLTAARGPVLTCPVAELERVDPRISKRRLSTSEARK